MICLQKPYLSVFIKQLFYFFIEDNFVKYNGTLSLEQQLPETVGHSGKGNLIPLGSLGDHLIIPVCWECLVPSHRDMEFAF